MVSPDNPSKSILSDTVRQRILAYFQGGWAKQLDVEQMFALVNGILPLEACLYYQVLPLFLDGNRLYLGMVTPNDTAALEYVRRILSYLNYSLVPRAITYEALQVALTAYLNFTGNEQGNEQLPDQVRPRQLFSYGHYRHSAQRRTDRIDPTARPTLILDDLEDLERPIDSTAQIDPTPQLEPDPPPQLHLSNLAEAISSPLPIAASDHLPVPDPPAALTHAIPTLEVQAHHLSSAVDELSTLPAAVMLQELLSRVLVGGIGRLYFECHPHYGRVLWSQDGVLQSVFDRLSLLTFSQLLEELKQFAELPSAAMTQPRQVEIERLYDGSRVLLRFRFMPGKHGEEATLQVLRGAALRFQQRQQLTKLKRDALGIVRQLQTKLGEIHDRSQSEPELADTNKDLPALNQLLQSIEDRLDTLGEARIEKSLDRE